MDVSVFLEIDIHQGKCISIMLLHVHTTIDKIVQLNFTC